MDHVFFCTGHALKIPNVIQSKGIYLYDEQGKRYMDLESGVWCTSIGHNHTEINEIIKHQTDTLLHAGFCYSNEIIEKSAKSILDVAGFNNKLIEKGYIVGNRGSSIRIDPPLTMTKTEIDGFIEVLRETISLEMK